MKVRVKRSYAGLGLFAEQPIEEGAEIIEYKGPILNERQTDEKGGMYLFELSKERTIDGSSRKNLARYINHSCEPNCEAVIVDDERVVFEAARDIQAGEELTYHYGKEYFDNYIKPKGCKCHYHGRY